jgi:hypothetical protein
VKYISLIYFDNTHFIAFIASDIKSSQPKVHVTPKLFAEETTQEEVSSSTIACEGCQSNTTFDKMVQCCDGHLNCNVCVEKVVKKILSHGNEEVRLIKFYCPFCGESFGMLDVSFLKE